VLEDPGFEAVHERFIEDNARAEGMTMHYLDYLLDAVVVGADLWVLLGQSKHGPAVIRVIRPDGSAGQQLMFPRVVGADKFTVDSARRRIYFVRPETADLLRSRFCCDDDVPRLGCYASPLCSLSRRSRRWMLNNRVEKRRGELRRVLISQSAGWVARKNTC
jgi:hypothetical protein